MRNESYYDQSAFLIIKAAYLYYIKNISQNAIAENLKISIPTVSRLIKKAREEKIVEFVIRDPYIDCIRLEENLKSIFKLKDVIIAPVCAKGKNLTESEDIKRLVALEGARYIQRIIKENDVLGITWGSTMYYLINYLNPCQKIGASFVTLHGSIACCDNELDVRTLVLKMAKAFSGKKYCLLTEGLMSNKNIANSIKNERNIHNVFQMFDNINISVSGIGSFYPTVNSALAKKEYLTPQELEELQKRKVVGDIALRFFDVNGNECNTDLVDRTISIDFKKFKNIKTKITIASGDNKAFSIWCALKGHLIDVLITDYTLGNSLLKLNSEIVSNA